MEADMQIFAEACKRNRKARQDQDQGISDYPGIYRMTHKSAVISAVLLSKWSYEYRSIIGFNEEI
ncbi:MAG: hypothetical protein ACOCS6_01680 [Desulfosalsimonas sp.]